jgi:WD40 repeat protein
MAQLQPDSEQSPEEDLDPLAKANRPFLAWKVLTVIRDALESRRRVGVLASLGCTLAAVLALGTQTWVMSVAPLAQQILTDEPNAVTSLNWYNKAPIVTVGSHRVEPVSVDVHGTRDRIFDPRERVAAAGTLIGQSEDLDAAQHALAGLPASDGAIFIRAQGADSPVHTDVLTPGGVFAITRLGDVVVTGAASVRDSSGRAQRPIVATGPDPGGIWRLARNEGKDNLQFARIASGASPVTSLAYIPSKDLVAAGSIDGNLRLIDATPPSALAPVRAQVRAHASEVLALATASQDFLPASAELASIAADKSIKVWSFEPEPASMDVGFADPLPELIFAPGGLELSPGGETLLLRTPAGLIFVARIGDGSWKWKPVPLIPPTTRGQTAQSPAAPQLRRPDVLLREVSLPVRTTVATLSKDGRSLFAAGTDCAIREVDLTPVFVSSAPRIAASVVAEFSGHGEMVTRLSLSPDGGFLAAASLDQRVRIHRLDRARTVSAIALSDIPTGPPCASTPVIEVARGRSASQKVFVQFAGALDRQAMITFALGLRDVGWNVQGADRGGERVAAAAGLNLIRYASPDDRAAAESLAGEVSRSSPAGRNITVELNRLVPAGTLEIWISN